MLGGSRSEIGGGGKGVNTAEGAEVGIEWADSESESEDPSP